MTEHQNLLDSVDARTRLAGSNKLEILLFSLGSGETFGINVFKVREVCKPPPITRTPNMPRGVEGLISLRGRIIPVLALRKFVNAGAAGTQRDEALLVTEYSRHIQGFLVREVEHIVRVDWDRVKAPDATLVGDDGLITAITQLPDGRLVSILDVEQVLTNAFGDIPVSDIAPLGRAGAGGVFFVDDSSLARRRIVEVLDKLGATHSHAVNGLEAWERLQAMAAQAQGAGVPLNQQLRLIMVDAEMPEMDGYVLTQRVKGDGRFAGIPVVMHSSLSSAANRAMGTSVGVDAYVAKFDSGILADTLRSMLA